MDLFRETPVMDGVVGGGSGLWVTHVGYRVFT